MTDHASVPRGCRVQRSGFESASFVPKIVPTSGTAHVKGGWTEYLSATTFDYEALFVYISARVTPLALIDIGIGATGDEQVIVENLMVQFSNVSGMAIGARIIAFPLYVPAGVRLSCRAQWDSTSASGPRCSIWGLSRSPFGFIGSRVLSLGINTGTTRGTEIDPGGTTETKGSWVQVASSLAADVVAVVPVFGSRGYPVGVAFDAWAIDVGIGAAGDEQVVIPDLAVVAWANTTSSGGLNVEPGSYPPIPVTVPSGMRVSARAACNETVSPDRLIDLALYGVVP